MREKPAATDGRGKWGQKAVVMTYRRGRRYYRERGSVTDMGQVNMGIPMLKVAKVAGLYH
jgi:hypothetical protein